MTKASPSVRIDVPAAIREAWDRAPDLVADVLARRILAAQLLFHREVAERTPKGATDALIRSIQVHEIGAEDGRLEGVVGTPLAYAAPVEFGTRPHKPPIAPLRLWVKKILGLSDKKADAAAEAIAWKIFHRGTKGAAMFQRAFDATESQITTILTGALDEIAAALTEGSR